MSSSIEEREDERRAIQAEEDFEERMKRAEERAIEMELPKEQRQKHWTDQGGIRNLTMEYLSPRPKPQGWICTKCDAQKMNLLPVSQDVPATHWECTKCNRQITIEERDQVFEAIRQQVIDKYQLKTFSYDNG